jgi:DNA-directed RNA polymerase specialized sigma24 family protein
MDTAAGALAEVDPVIRGAIRRKLHVTLRANDFRERNLDALDLLGEVQLKLLAKLRNTEPLIEQAQSISEFSAYAATVAYHCCADYLRAKYPRRASLKNRLYRLLDRIDDYASWTNRDGDLICGGAGWQNREPASAERIAALRHGYQAISEEAIPQTPIERISVRQWVRLLDAIFGEIGAPLKLDDLLAIIAPLTDGEDVAEFEHAEADEDETACPVERLAASSPDAYTRRLSVERLRLFWGAVTQLLPWHRAAYLLNIRDGELDALPYYGVVSMHEIGETLELTDEQMEALEQEAGIRSPTGSAAYRMGERFVRCWAALPLDDNAIARVLGVTRPQVIGYRNKARERMARMLRGVV